MNNGHLSDEHIQEFLDGRAYDSAPLCRHLDACPSCRRAADEYRVLFGLLAAEPVYSPASDLVDCVLGKLPEQRGFFTPLVRRFLIAAAAACVVVTPFFFIDARPLLASLKGLAPAYTAAVSALFEPARIVLQRLNGNAPLLLFAALTFGFAAVADHFLKRRLLGSS